MVKRKCGTCKFFKSAGMAGSGWCEHPQRVELQNLVMVRKSELACRNGWDQDLWQPAKEAVVAGRNADDATAIHRSDQAGPPSAAPSRELAAHQESADPSTQDEVTDIAVPSGRRQVGRSPRLLHNWPGNIRKDDVDREQDQVLSSNATDNWRQRIAEAPKYDEQSRFSDSNWSRSDLDRSSSGVARVYNRHHNGEDEQRAAQAAGVHRNDESAAPRGDPEGRSASSPSNRDASVSRTSAPTVHVDSPAPVSWPTAQDSDKVKQHTEPLPTDAINEHLAFRSSNNSFSGAAETGRSARSEDIATTPSTRPFVYVDGPALSETDVAQPPTPRARQEPASEQDPIDNNSRSAEITRCCGTCRDFRRNGDGETGVCMNPYAFRDRPMVKCDQLACRSSVGVWWLPHDDVWLERADTLHHTRPTPYLDAALGVGVNSESWREARTHW